MAQEVERDEYDSPWKEALEAHAGIDWVKGFEFLDKELQQIVGKGKLGRRTVDKLAGVHLRVGGEAWVLIHVEVQSQRDASFAERMYIYNYRLFDRYHRQVASFAVLADDRPSFRPCAFGDTLWGCEVSLRFPVVKLLDYRKRWAELERSRNPFAVVVTAHLEALRTRHDPASRELAKLSLVRELHRRGFGEKDIRQLLRFIDLLMTLPEELQEKFLNKVREFEEQTRMPLITQTERMGIEKGRAEGRREGLCRAVLDFLEARLGKVPVRTGRALQRMDAEALDALFKQLLRANDEAEMRTLLPKG